MLYEWGVWIRLQDHVLDHQLAVIALLIALDILVIGFGVRVIIQERVRLTRKKTVIGTRAGCIGCAVLIFGVLSFLFVCLLPGA